MSSKDKQVMLQQISIANREVLSYFILIGQVLSIESLYRGIGRSVAPALSDPSQ